MTVKDINLPAAFVNYTFSYTLTAINNAGSVTFAVTSPALPAGVTLSAGGVLSGTPTAAGTYSVDFSVTDGTDTIFRGYQLVVYAVDLTTPGDFPNATGGVAYSTTLAASGGSGGY
jgi:large repetitive protein